MKHAARILQIETLAAAGLPAARIATVANITVQAVKACATKNGIPLVRTEGPTLRRLRECAAAGMTRAEAGRAVGITLPGISRYAKLHGLVFVKRSRAEPPSERERQMESLYRAGYTLQQIGDQFGVTRERVRQLLRWRMEVPREEGGQALRAETRRRKATESENSRCLAKYGCSQDVMREVRALGRALRERGVSYYRTPRGAFSLQKRNAATRGIPWELTFWQWWSIWQASGKWDKRGRGQGYVMCRSGDEGPYSASNVFIALAAENSSERKGKKSGLPRGVRGLPNGKFAALRRIGGKPLHLGTYQSPELAHAAYLAATPTEGRAA